MIFNENKIIAQAYMSMLAEKKMDPVGKENGDIDNDGDKDKSDAYLHARRKAISTSIKKEAIDIEMPKKSSMSKELEKDEDEMDDDEDDADSKSMKVKTKTNSKAKELDELSVNKMLSYRSKATEKLGSDPAKDAKRKAGIGVSGMKVKAKLKNEDVEIDEASLKVPTATGMKVYGGAKGGSAKSQMHYQYSGHLGNVEDPSDKELKSIEKEKKKPRNEAANPPFDMPYKKTEEPKKDKSGATHGPMSRAKHLARQAMKNQMKEAHNIDITDYQADELIEAASLHELSKSTLGSYVKKAKGSAIGGAQVMGMGSKMTGQNTQDKAQKQVQKRASGMNKAVDRLTKEGYEWDWEAIFEASDDEIDSLIEQLDGEELESFINEFDSLDEGSYQSSTTTRQPMNANGQETAEFRAPADKVFATAHKVVAAKPDQVYRYNQHAAQHPQAPKRPGDERNSEPKKTLSDIRKR